jgi:hypothetical protein
LRRNRKQQNEKIPTIPASSVSISIYGIFIFIEEKSNDWKKVFTLNLYSEKTVKLKRKLNSVSIANKLYNQQQIFIQ